MSCGGQVTIQVENAEAFQRAIRRLQVAIFIAIVSTRATMRFGPPRK